MMTLELLKKELAVAALQQKLGKEVRGEGTGEECLTTHICFTGGGEGEQDAEKIFLARAVEDNKERTGSGGKRWWFTSRMCQRDTQCQIPEVCIVFRCSDVAGNVCSLER